jgi:hypothetical protein
MDFLRENFEKLLEMLLGALFCVAFFCSSLLAHDRSSPFTYSLSIQVIQTK